MLYWVPGIAGLPPTLSGCAWFFHITSSLFLYVIGTISWSDKSVELKRTPLLLIEPDLIPVDILGARFKLGIPFKVETFLKGKALFAEAFTKGMIEISCFRGIVLNMSGDGFVVS